MKPTFFILLGFLFVRCIAAESPHLSLPSSEVVLSEFSQLQEPLVLLLTGNRRFEGTIANVNEDRISLRVIQAGGEIVLGFSPNEIRHVHFSGEEILAEAKEKIENEEWESALPLLEALLLQRQALFFLLDPAEKSIFVHLPKAALISSESAKAITYAEFLLGHLDSESEKNRLEDSLLLAYYTLQLYDEAIVRAEQWMEEHPHYYYSALGYFIRSAIYFKKGDYEEAFWLSLEPIVFSGQTPVDYLSHCYTIAIAAAHIGNKKGYSDRLQREMLNRGLSWQYLRVFEEARNELTDLLILREDEMKSLPLFEAAPPDENLLIELDRSVSDGPFIDPSGLLPL